MYKRQQQHPTLSVMHIHEQECARLVMDLNAGGSRRERALRALGK